MTDNKITHMCCCGSEDIKYLTADMEYNKVPRHDELGQITVPTDYIVCNTCSLEFIPGDMMDANSKRIKGVRQSGKPL